MAYKPSEKDTRTVFPNGDSERKIYNHAPLLDFEEKAYNEYRRRAKAENWPKSFQNPESFLGVDFQNLRIAESGRLRSSAAAS